MPRIYEVIVTYRLLAKSEEEAANEVFNDRVEPDAVDVSSTPYEPQPEIEIIPF